MNKPVGADVHTADCILQGMGALLKAVALLQQRLNAAMSQLELEQQV